MSCLSINIRYIEDDYVDSRWISLCTYPNSSVVACAIHHVKITIEGLRTRVHLDYPKILTPPLLLPIANLSGNQPIACSGKHNLSEKQSHVGCLALRSRGMWYVQI